MQEPVGESAHPCLHLGDDLLAYAKELFQGEAGVAVEQLEQLRSFPEITRDELIKYFTLTPAAIAFVDPGRGRGPTDRLLTAARQPKITVSIQLLMRSGGASARWSGRCARASSPGVIAPDSCYSGWLGVAAPDS
ncbi:hypothetical protein [Actinomadura rubrisoli]|uniref:hypothetical protein n=1 Tax=Actinomadura rubrisoli TaxID=2530368 RepID=UPI001A9D26D5|nr:hypothetical protein [Actinomadura rubrisoli]